jgi:hypothetical protein
MDNERNNLKIQEFRNLGMGKTYHLPDHKGRYSSFLKEESL